MGVEDRGRAWGRGTNQTRAESFRYRQHNTSSRSWGRPLPSFNFIKRNIHPAPPCPSARIHSSARILKTSNSPKPPSNTLAFPSNSPSNSPSSTRKCESKGSTDVAQCSIWTLFAMLPKRSYLHRSIYETVRYEAKSYLIAKSVSPVRYS